MEFSPLFLLGFCLGHFYVERDIKAAALAGCILFTLQFICYQVN